MKTSARLLIALHLALPAVAVVPGCTSAGIAVRERLGQAKREQLVDRVQDARDAQDAARVQFASALDQFLAVTGVQGGDLEARYRGLQREFDRSKSRARAVTARIDAVEAVADALFTEWNAELAKFSSPELRRASEQQLADTQRRYRDLLAVMNSAADRMDPVLARFNDQVLFLKHNLNARAIAGLQGTAQLIQSDVADLIAEMEASIAQANAFIAQMQPQTGPS